MDLSSILRPDAVKVISETSSKKRLFQRLGDAAASAYGLDSETAVEALLERESLGPTGVGNGIALPHARMNGATGVTGVFFKLERALDFDSVDRQPVDLVFALFAPEDAGVEHLKALALISRTMRDSSVCSKLRANGDPTTLHTVLTEGVSPKAA
ncbi:phosphotransferase IIA-like nitrogen-regulatory protein PtsN [Aliiruegeria haliotis]|uniref:Phosphotransferase IIA-like nitrogen-regulatory protein PtsN n=1 Tax=Aliiruegeria haliotis TaxID=1280846 RepID=A0A2T0RPE8_9RHOB|nr:PTS sugar transporter subunit IIA [Aliiruegeria haliotis]PRY23065.1 phosphotransferase IIA-like nitrogen-regulatory protein PtsN [Aliiruegeria haliotis]